MYLLIKFSANCVRLFSIKSFGSIPGSTGKGARTTQVRLDYKLVYEIEKNDNTYKQTYEDMSFVDFNQSDLLAFEGEVEALKAIFIARALKNMEFFLSTQLNEIK